MAIDILSIQPNVISRDLTSKYILLAGPPKSGKTTFCTMAPGCLVLAFERGTNARAGAMVQPVEKWSEMKVIIRQLRKPEAMKMYKTVAIDTVAIAYDCCEKYICQQNGVQKIGDLPYGSGYKLLSDEFSGCLRELTMMGYGVIMTSHLKQSLVSSDEEKGETYSYTADLNNRCLKIVNGLVDVIGVIMQEWNDKNECERYLITRATPTITAGSRYQYLDPKIPFGYQELEDAIGRAIDKEAEIHGNALVADHVEQKQSENLDFGEVRKEAENLWIKLVYGEGDEPSVEAAKAIEKKIEMIFGKTMKLSDVTEDQVDLLQLVVLEMRDMVKE